MRLNFDQIKSYNSLDCFINYYIGKVIILVIGRVITISLSFLSTHFNGRASLYIENVSL